MSTPNEKKRLRILLAKSDMDAHERGVRYLAQVLRDRGMEVIFIRYRIVEEVVATALEEGVDVIGLSFYGSGLMYDTSKVMDLIREKQMDNILVIVGGTIPSKAIPELKRKGVRGIFAPGGSMEDVVSFIEENTRNL